ncbi:ADP-ribose pyrophosphatase, mitochondrial [Oratosquilla oratoria]|uniref:ADP-ribose pyrophosphatase, mitochondrial n=1 Tax=Oratosquilla oratoria TaxID=337810 RepID=UPI003F765353
MPNEKVLLCASLILLSQRALSSTMMHTKCRGKFYPRGNNKVIRFSVPDEKVRWAVPFPEYAPVSFTTAGILAGPSFADPDISETLFKPKWNELDGNVDRRSHEGTYEVVDGYPRNKHGRTGVMGRGCLGRWGPNHAADPVVTRWKIENESRVINPVSKKPVLQFVCIQRKDSGEWAIPGGMVDPGEKVSSTLRREFEEEALDALQMTAEERQIVGQKLKDLFEQGKEIYAGYIDDPRNTDNAWMESVACNFHDEDLKGILHKLELKAGDDAKSVKWMDLDKELELYASHKDIVHQVTLQHGAHW